jgi:hypothetical protein
VDAVYGNDTSAALDRYRLPFLTISAALLLAAAGENVVVRAGAYNESITLPSSVSLTGAGTQCVTIQRLGVSAPTTLVTMGTNSRLENVTCLLSSSGDHDLIGVDYPSGTSISSKVRSAVITVTSTSAAAPTILGLRSSGASATSYSSANPVARSTVNVVSAGTGVSRALLVNGANRFSVRETILYASGAGTNLIGMECNHASAVIEVKTSTLGGVLYDIARTAGTILIGSTIFLNNNTNTNSFTALTQSSATTFGIIGNPGSNTTYNLVPGTILIGNLPATAFQIPVPSPTILFSGIIRYTGTIGVGVSVTFNVYKNASVSPSFSITLNSGENTKQLTTTSVNFLNGDTYHATLVTVGNPDTGTFTSTIQFY